MRMDGLGEVPGSSAHLNRMNSFADELPRPGADDPDAEDTLGLGLNDELGQTIALVHGERAAGGAPRETGDLHRNILLPGLRLGKSAPGDLRLGKNDGGDNDIFKSAFLTKNIID